VRDTLVRIPDLAPGDVVATNDPFAGGGGHLSDVAMVRPIFVNDAIVAFACAKGHWTEVGGKDPGSWTADSVDIFQEGLQLPFVRVGRGGELDRDLVAIIGANSRLPDMTIGDLTAFAACLEVAERRLLEVCRRYGVDDVTAAMRAAHERSEALSRAAVGRLPRGVFGPRISSTRTAWATGRSRSACASRSTASASSPTSPAHIPRCRGR
jgi:N-methylhydantoinase B